MRDGDLRSHLVADAFGLPLALNPRLCVASTSSGPVPLARKGFRVMGPGGEHVAQGEVAMGVQSGGTNR